jgi:hypothetical protein
MLQPPKAHNRGSDAESKDRPTDASHRIIDAARDWPFTNQKCVRNTGQTFLRVVVFKSDGLA